VASIRDRYLGPYRLLSMLATGQNTHVWEAIHDGERRRVAIKRIKAEKPTREQIGFLRHEYAVGKTLDHPRVVKALEIGVARGETYLVLELFSAPNMKWWIQQGADRIAYRAPQIIDQCAEGMIYLAEKGWIHRDIKPDNFLISKAGEVKIIDFALAQKRKTGLAALLGGGSKKIQGTPSYMSPEQIRGKTLDLKADVYSFGCTIYELTSGRKPFTGTRPQELLSKHLGGQVPSLSAANRNVTPEFSALVVSMLAKNPRERPDIEQFRRELQAMQVFKVPPQPPGEAGADTVV
jgi:serine/threonine-protein kinase